MNQIILQKDERRLIGVMLGEDNLKPTVIPAKAGIKGRILDQVENDKRLDVILAGENSEIEIAGLLMAKGESQTAFEVYITHTGKNTKSKVNVRAVLRGKSTFAFRGNVKIEKGAKGADAYLRSDALLFDDAKMGDDTPALEILERDVKAGHAATIGKVDEQMLFYLMSRGISRSQAEKLLIRGFVNPILDKINRIESQKRVSDG
jgi:Fe-S cluster assembly protein SufD